MRSEEEVDKMIEDMKNRTKGKYITQGCSFNKSCPRQMDLLKKALMSSASFSGLAKEILAVTFGGAVKQFTHVTPLYQEPERKNKNVGNFI